MIGALRQSVLQFLVNDRSAAIGRRPISFRFSARDRHLFDPVVTSPGRVQRERRQYAFSGDPYVAPNNVGQFKELRAQTFRSLANLFRVGLGFLTLQLVHVRGQRPDVQLDHQGLYAVAEL